MRQEMPEETGLSLSLYPDRPYPQGRDNLSSPRRRLASADPDKTLAAGPRGGGAFASPTPNPHIDLWLVVGASRGAPRSSGLGFGDVNVK